MIILLDIFEIPDILMRTYMNPKISIIIPVYNAELYLYHCLTSIINQSLQELEIVCVNDGSTDNFLNILNEFAKNDSRIKIINQENKGASVARNNALKFAHGEFIGFVDADDTIEKDFYECLYNNAIKYGAEIACGEIRRPDSKRNKDVKNLIYRKIKTADKTEQKYKLCRIPERCFVVNKIYKREALIKSGIEFPAGYTYEDIFWSHRVIHQLGKLVVVPKAVYNYYWNYSDIPKYRGNNVKCNNFADALAQSIEYAFKNKIRIRNYKFYTPLKRIRINILGIRFFDLRIWNSVKVFYVLGIEVCRIFINNNI